MDNYEEKYKQAFKKALDLYNQGLINPPLEHIFPELKESEDEKIKRELRNDLLLYVPTPERYIAWLEKQGHMLDPDKVIEWLKAKVDDDSTYGMAMIEKFKKDFGL